MTKASQQQPISRPGFFTENGTHVYDYKTVNRDNKPQRYCWSNLSHTKHYKVYFGFGSGGGGQWVYGTGSLTSS